MNQTAARVRPKRNAIGSEEERAWVSFYRRAGKDPAIAAEVLAQLDTDPEMKREHLALYLCCRESLRLHQAREARNQRFGRFVRGLLGALFVRFPASARRALGHGGDLAAACLPEEPSEPAATQIQRLTKSPTVRAARAAFKTPAAPQAASEAVNPAPRAAQATG
ncbi:hypothetical protein HMPREF9701_02132 [Delftia acidovorans CCUG 274B]|uniref:hypothetical protein n=1 Tax=Delftia acidovorans TaxID=80866 RepID=UPI00035306BE|nr:hypothetical protein [Delftia acidovorans]EPD41063.1 hypothetical protein HMPREF9701_02132 [Delftia acidovorans CCUG 274B]PZP62938.1 MAG: hypothetical protein DI604_28280 [Delftia acidovorans]